MPIHSPFNRPRTKDTARSRTLGATAVIFALATSALSFEIAREQNLARIEERAVATALSHGQALASVLATQRAVGAILSDDLLLQKALENPSAAILDEVSFKLEQLRDKTQGNVIYMLNIEGTALASSNWLAKDSFVGGDFSFRDYFHKALLGETALEYAEGRISGKSGLYLSHRILSETEEQTLGVIVVKIDFDHLESIWGGRADITRVYDGFGNLVLTSFPDMAQAPNAKRSLNVSAEVRGAAGWHVELSTSTAQANRAGLISAATTLAVLSLLGWLAARTGRTRRVALARARAQERYREDLELAVSARTRALTAEAAERRAAEASLARMQADLVQANKLATLGQVTAGLAHEVNQPVATIRLLAENAVSLMSSAPQEVSKNLDKIIRMADRIGQITTHLRGFSRKATGEIGAVEVKEIIDASLLLTASRRRNEGAHLRIEGARNGIRIKGEAVRLEQILVNLIQNAQEALNGHPEPRIKISVSADSDHVTLSVTDNGPGVSPEIESQIFMPFATSKRDGVGLGLVIAREIARDLGGDLTLAPQEQNQGATFVLQLVRA